jgi:hypothetical protein
MSLLCSLGCHRWERRRVWEWRTQYGALSLDGRVCRNCCRIHPDSLREMEQTTADAYSGALLCNLSAPGDQ